MLIELSIVVLHFNRWDLTKDCLTSIDTQPIPYTYEKVLVDNGSTIPLPNPPDGWRLIRYEQNRGHIVGQNRCFESAQGEWVLFVANDIRLQAGCLNAMWTFKHEQQISQPTLFTQAGEIDNRGLAWCWPGYGLSCQKLTDHPTTVSGSCYLMRKQVWKNVGGFDAHLTSSYEDVLFGLQARQRGVTSDWSPAWATHLGNATLRHQPSHNRSAFHRDRVSVIKKCYRGVDRALRLAAVCLLDSIPRP